MPHKLERSSLDEMVEYSSISNLTVTEWLSTWRAETDLLLQNRLLDEGAFLRFARDRGMRLGGIIQGEPGRLHGLGWLTADGIEGASLHFHPFRLLPLKRVLEACDPNITSASFIDRDQAIQDLPRVFEYMPTHEQISTYAGRWGATTDLAVLLDPIYWPTISSQHSRPGFIDEDEFAQRGAVYRQNVLSLVRDLSVDDWHRTHESLRFDAWSHDGNGALYLLLRLAPWHIRDRLRGAVSMALWFRHMAELVRRAFEEVHGVEWEEEDRAGEMWTGGARVRLYGSTRPLDRPLSSRPYLAFEFGLFTGSVVRWYLEGETEFFAATEALPEAAKGGIELVNLRGSIAHRRGNAPMSLSDGLRQDLALRRFSIISFDTDVEDNVRTIRRQVEQGHVVGFIAAQRPDFEFANFAIDELVEIAAQLDESHGVSGAPVREGDWTAVRSGREFETRYRAISARRPASLKGEDWGRAMARYAMSHPSLAGSDEDRPFLQSIGAALRSRMANYDYQRAAYTFDRNNFELVRIPTVDT